MDIGHALVPPGLFLKSRKKVLAVTAEEKALLLLAGMVAAYAPDMDFVLGALVSVLGYNDTVLSLVFAHRGASHGLVSAGLVGASIGYLLSAFRGYTGDYRFKVVVRFALVGLSHPIFDLMNRGSHTPLLAPFSMEKYEFLFVQVIRGKHFTLDNVISGIFGPGMWDQLGICLVVAFGYWTVFLVVENFLFKLRDKLGEKKKKNPCR